MKSTSDRFHKTQLIQHFYFINIEKNKNKIIFLFFFILFCVGVSIFKDYGAHWDEYYNQEFGRGMVNYMAHTAQTRRLLVYMPTEHDKIHGPVFEIFLNVLKSFLGLKDSRDIVLMRHLSVFLLFYIGVLFFYFLCLKYFRNWKLALLGCLFLVLSPRIFADAFYNTVDMPFLVFFIIGSLTFMKMLDEKSPLSSIVHALVCAILINIRLIGLILPISTAIFFSLEMVSRASYQNKIRGLRNFVYFLLFFLILSVFFCPFLWSNPLANFNTLIDSVEQFKTGNNILYFGRFINYRSEPWHYAPVWILITTPLLYTILFFISCFSNVKLLFKNPIRSSLKTKNAVIFLLWFFLILFVTKGRLYNGWRHIYFIYPFFLISALTGLSYLWQSVGRFLLGKTRWAVQGLVVILIIANFLDTSIFMIRNHPYENIYFNGLVNHAPEKLQNSFDLDYWGLSYRKALEYILTHDKDPLIRICVANNPGLVNIRILPVEDRKRIIGTSINTRQLNRLSVEKRKRITYELLRKSKYFLTNLVLKPPPYPFEEYFFIKADGLKILIIYKLDHQKDVSFVRSS